MRDLIRVVGLFILMLSLAGCAAKRDPLETLRSRALETDRDALAARMAWPKEALTPQSYRDLVLKNNLDMDVMRQRLTIQDETRRQACLRMLPTLEVSGEWSKRNNFSASSSIDVETGDESLTASYSSPKITRRAQMAALWNVLDFGISHVMALQEGDRYRILEQRARRLRQNLALRATETFWKCAVAQDAMNEAKAILKQLEERHAVLDGQEKERAISETDAVERRKKLLRMQLQLERFEVNYLETRLAMARLAGMSDDGFTLAETPYPELPAIRDLHPRDRLLEEALRSRPELIQEDLEARISLDDVRVATLRILPSPAAFLNWDYDHNPLLTHNNWRTAGVRASWNLLSIPAKIRGRRAAEAQVELAQKRRLAAHVGVVSQVGLAITGYEQSMKRLKLVHRYWDYQSRSLALVKQRMEKEGDATAADLLEAESGTVLAHHEYRSAYVRALVDAVRIENAIGRDTPGQSPKTAFKAAGSSGEK